MWFGTSREDTPSSFSIGLLLRLPVSAIAYSVAVQFVDYTIAKERVAMSRTKKQSSEAAVWRLGETTQ